ncbi:ATP-binding response regulator [Roseiconus lacunae]|uniref:Response regulator n=1 Tax=Roseiconus lacunae TaxID=2605694 RepID=A0ABT7PKN8_9BACT|nr:response regulator [Roseiconus lacunae]MDM4017047.1 response regulator [Roseiconus lacunae]
MKAPMCRVLVVDDSATQMTLMTSILRGREFDVDTASDGAEAIGRVAKRAPDLIVTDMQMPEVNGVELIRKLRSEAPMIPSILVTAFGTEGLAAEALGVGACNYISKDHLGVLLPDTVHRMCQLLQANRESLYLKAALSRRTFEFVLDSSIERLTPCVCMLTRMLAAMNVLHTVDRLRIAEAIHYTLLHCIVHGNCGEPLCEKPYSIADAMELVSARRREAGEASGDRCVTLRVSVKSSEVEFLIGFDGDGPSIRQSPMPGTPQSFADERGRGMLLLTSVMDELFIDPVTLDLRLTKYLD